MCLLIFLLLARIFALPVVATAAMLLGLGYTVFLFIGVFRKRQPASPWAFMVAASLTAILIRLTLYAWNDAEPIGGNGYF
jgi:hypothetical protein